MVDSAVQYGRSYRDLIAFWIFGLSNNFAYVVMLSAANDIIKTQERGGSMDGSAGINGSSSMLINDTCIEDLGKPKCWNEMSTGAVLIANIIPSLLVKITFPFFMHRIPYGPRHISVCMIQALSYLVVAFSWRIEVSLFGVILASFGSGLGEICYLALSSHYSKEVITAWSSGTGGAGIFGALAYAALTEPHLANFTPKQTLLLMLIVPFGFVITYWTLLNIAPTIHRVKIFDANTWVVPSQLSPAANVDRSVEDSQGKSKAHNIRSTNLQDFANQLKLIVPLLRFMIPLSIVYVSEYIINSGMHQLIDFDCAHGFQLSVDSQFRWYQTLYQVGVFVSRTSVGCLELPIVCLYALPLFQMGLVVVFLCEALFFYIPHIAILFMLTFVEGLFGGASYANTFNRIHRKVNPEVREFSMSITSLSDSLGITLAGFVSIAIHNYICQLRANAL